MCCLIAVAPGAQSVRLRRLHLSSGMLCSRPCVASCCCQEASGALTFLICSAQSQAPQSCFVYPYILAPELGMSYAIGKLPYAVLLDPQGVVASQGLVNSREHIESLFESHRMAAPPAAVPQPASFAMCAACHTTTANGAHGMGPNLRGVAGRRAASKPGFNYSAAMRRSNVTWNRADLDA